MRSLKSGLIAIALSGLFGTAAVVGCTADGGGSGIDMEADPTNPDPDGGSVVPPRDEDFGDAGHADAGKKKDSGPKAEAGVDAGPPPPVEGTACTALNKIGKKSCGMCGFAETVCLDDGTGKGTWSPYGECGSEQGSCLPGATQPCGNCGTQTCTSYCAWGACLGQPASSCTPGAVDLTTAGCPADTYRQRTCQANCAFDSYTLVCEAPPTFLNVPGAVGATVTALMNLKATETVGRLSGTCPTGTVNTSQTPYSYFEIRNPTTKSATVSIFHTQAAGGGVLDTVIAAYAGATPPGTDAARKACLKGVNDFGVTALTGDGNFGSLTGTSALVIAPGASVTVYSAQYYVYDASDPEKAAGKLNINVRTDLLE